jgi:hypothetical protein
LRSASFTCCVRVGGVGDAVVRVVSIGEVDGAGVIVRAARVSGVIFLVRRVKKTSAARTINTPMTMRRTRFKDFEEYSTA